MNAQARVGGPIVILGSYAPSLINFRGKLIEELVARGYEVVAMAPDLGEDVASALRAIGARPLDVRLAANPLNPTALMSSVMELTRLFREMKPQALIAYTIQPATIGVLAAARAGVPKIIPLITGLGYPFSKTRSIKRRLSRAGAVLLYRLSLAKASIVIFQNPDDKRDLAKAGGYSPRTPAAIVNGSGVDIHAFAPAPLPGKPSFLMVARLIPDKGIFEYAEAARRLKTEHRGARFALAGWIDGSPSSISSADLDRIIEGGVEYLGKLPDVRPAIAGCNVFVLPSGYREGVPRSILEALAMGRPVITCDMPGCRETVRDGTNGFLIPPFDADALTRAMERFILDPSLSVSMGKESRRIAEEKYDVRHVNRALIEAAGL